MTDILERAKALQLNIACETQMWIKLDLFEAMIAEIEMLRQHQMPRAISSIKDIGALEG